MNDQQRGAIEPTFKRVLALMQNQWLLDAATHQRMQDRMKEANLERWWKLRERLIPYALFAGCRSGRVLSSYLGGPDITSRIVWEEASTRIGDKPSSCPPPEPDHIRAVLERYNPDYILTLGKVAHVGLWDAIGGNLVAPDGFRRILIAAPHPAARAPRDHAALKVACQTIRDLVTNPTP